MEEIKQTTNYEEQIKKTLLELFESLNSASFSATNDTDFPIAHLDPDYETVFGPLEANPFQTNIGLLDLIHPREVEAFRNRLDQSLREGNKINDIVQLNPLYQEKKWVWITGKAIFDENRTLDRLEGYLTDITGPKNTVDQLRKQESFYFHILNQMPIELVVLNAQHRYIFCSKSAISDPETREWIIGKTDFDYCEYRNKDIKIAWERRRNFEKVKAEKKEMEWEEVFLSEQGDKIYKLRKLSPIFDQDGDLQMVIGYGFDITKRRLAEERARENEKLLTSINDNLQDGIYRYSPQKGFLYINDAFARIFHYKDRQTLLNNSEAFFAYDAESRNSLIDIKGKTGSFNNRELLLTRKDGSQFWGLVNCKKNVDENQDVIFDGAISEITDLKETERLYKQKNQELRKAYKELDQFIYSASHDLRSPLTSILGIVDIMELDFEDKELLHYVSMVRKSVQKLDDFVQDLIDYYRNSRSAKSHDQIDFEKLINDSFINFEYLEGANQIYFNSSVNLKQPIYSDEYRIKIILNNLISNAIKYHNLASEYPYVHVDVYEGKGKCILEVSDNGKGIKQENLNKVFDMFFRASQDSKSSGLGLYIVKEAVEKLNGSIDINSTPGQGTRFTIAFKT